MKRFGILRVGCVIALLALALFALASAAFASSEDAIWPEHPGTVVEKDGKLTIDMSNAADGYFMACVEPTKNRVRMRITVKTKQVSGQFMYEINNTGEYEAYPLQFGSGTYKVELFENVKSNKYAGAGTITVKAELETGNEAFLVPNQYVYYTQLSETVLKSDELTAGLTDQAAIYKAVCDFMADEFSYDFVRAKTISSGELPEVDPCFLKRSGICQDLAAVMVCMLRVQGVPAKLMIGYADKYYHAWTSCVVNGEEIFFDPTAAIGAMNAKKYQIERYY